MKKQFTYLIMNIFLNINLFAQNIPPYTDLLKYEEDEHLFSFSVVQMWGWSRNGKVAFSIKKGIDGRGGTITTAFIFNFVDDIILWEESIDSFDEDADYDGFYKEYNNVCIQNGIEFVQVEFEKLPMRHNNQTYNVIVEFDDRDNDSIDCRVSVETQGKRKMVQRNSLGGWPLGYFISPFENRALIAMGRGVRAFEGYDIEFYFIGCHLINGFR
jgi:hypothetical protein